MNRLIEIAKEIRLKTGMLESPEIYTVQDAINFLRIAGEHNTDIKPDSYFKLVG